MSDLEELNAEERQYLDSIDPRLLKAFEDTLDKSKNSTAPRLLVNIIRTAVENMALLQSQKDEEERDPLLSEIEVSAPLSYWKKECPELFDYPENMHGYKTSWALLKGIYCPEKHGILYYHDLRNINNKLYRAVGRKNREECFLPNHSEKVKSETDNFINSEIPIKSIDDNKSRHKYYSRIKRKTD